MAHTDAELLEWAESVATKFQVSRDGWYYTRDLGDLERIRYKSDHTGYNSFWRRLKRALNVKMLLGTDSLSMQIFGKRKPSLKRAWVWFVVSMEKDKNLPDAVIGNAAIICHWEEDAEYITLFGPTVGKIIIDWMKANPEDETVKKILKEQHRLADLSLEHLRNN